MSNATVDEHTRNIKQRTTIKRCFKMIKKTKEVQETWYLSVINYNKTKVTRTNSNCVLKDKILATDYNTLLKRSVLT